MPIDFHRAAFALILALAPAPLLLAHGDEDHGAAKPAQPAVAGLRIASATTERFEVVIKFPAVPLGKPASAHLFLSDAETNVPIAGAKVTFEVPDQGIKIIASPDKESGIYSFELIAKQAGSFDGMVGIEPSGEGDPDVLPISGLELGPIAIAPNHHLQRWIGAGVLLLMAALAALAAIYARIRRRRISFPDAAISPEAAQGAS